jgi:hypothetical protein
MEKPARMVRMIPATTVMKYLFELLIFFSLFVAFYAYGRARLPLFQ